MSAAPAAASVPNPKAFPLADAALTNQVSTHSSCPKLGLKWANWRGKRELNFKS